MKKIIISILIIVIGMILLLKFQSVHEEKIRHKNFESKIKYTIENKWKNGEKEINLNDVTDFKWEKVYIFQPYAKKEFIDKKIGLNFEDYDKSAIEHNDHSTLLVFVAGDEIVFFDDLPKSISDLISINDGTSFNSNEAMFEILKTKDNWYQLISKDSNKNMENYLEIIDY